MVGPGSVPLKVWACAVTPLPMSTVASSATIDVSITSGAGFVSTISGTVYGSPPLVALPGARERTSRSVAAIASAAAASRMSRRPCHLVVVADTGWYLAWSSPGGPAPGPAPALGWAVQTGRAYSYQG